MVGYGTTALSILLDRRMGGTGRASQESEAEREIAGVMQSCGPANQVLATVRIEPRRAAKPCRRLRR